MGRPLRTIITQPSAQISLEAAYEGDTELADKAFHGPSFILARAPEMGTRPYLNSSVYMLAMEPKGIWIGAFVYYSYNDQSVTIHKFVFAAKG